MFIQTETTPNPSTLKFLPGRAVLDRGVLEFRNRDEAAQSPLALRIFDIDGVAGVMFGADFIAVTKDRLGWHQLKPAVLGAIMEHYLSGAETLASDVAETEVNDEFYEPGDAEIVAAIKDLLETRVRPAVATDGGDITFRGFREGVVYLNMKGACSGCPSSTATLKHGIQNLLQHFVPGVQEVQAM